MSAMFAFPTYIQDAEGEGDQLLAARLERERE
jgi:hypothetical protein